MVICFDVDDYTSPEYVGMDDLPKWLAGIMIHPMYSPAPILYTAGPLMIAAGLAA